jgi:uncharacterized membrane protein YfcA
VYSQNETLTWFGHSQKHRIRFQRPERNKFVNILELTLLIGLGSVAAGFLGSLTGLGGGVVIVPLLTLAFKVHIHYAIGASLVSVIATSSGAGAAYLKEGFSNIRIGMFLEIATTLGALAGAFLGGWIAPAAIAVIFGFVLLGSAILSLTQREDGPGQSQPDRLAVLLQLSGSYPSLQGPKDYHACAVPSGFGLMFIAGALSGLLGIGSGALKVLAMDQVMRIPFKVSTATSNFMIGVTAAASVGVYLSRGFIDPGLAMPVMLGVLTGAFLGTRVMVRVKTRSLRIVFCLVIFTMAGQMIYNGWTEKF